MHINNRLYVFKSSIKDFCVFKSPIKPNYRYRPGNTWR